MRKRYLPFGYQIKHGEIAIALKESNAVRFIFEEYLAGKSLKGIADIMSAKDIPYHEGTQKWNQNMVGRILASKIYYDNVKYPPIISETQYNLAEKRRCEKHQAYSTILQPFRQDMQCGCCDERLYWHPKTNQWFCRRCGMWAKPLRAEETSAAIAEKLCWLRQNPEIIHTPEGQANVQSVEVALLDREIWQALTNAEPDVDALVAKILHRAEMEYKFCTAGDARSEEHNV